MAFTGVTKAHGPSPPANSMQQQEVTRPTARLKPYLTSIFAVKFEPKAGISQEECF